jgi:hypothetical protein
MKISKWLFAGLVAGVVVAAGASCGNATGEKCTPANCTGVCDADNHCGFPPTYYKDVLPITQASCNGCHTTGGIAPFALDSYEGAKAKAPLMADATQQRRMPPWKANKDCGGTFVGDRTLTQPQIDTIQNWFLAGSPEGKATDAPAPIDASAEQLERVDFTATMSAPYTPTLKDDYRCFIIDPGLTSAKMVTGYNIKPGSSKVVHHVILYIVDKNAAQTEDAKDATPGWQCFGGANVDTNGALGAWAPGGAAIHFPKNTGISMPAGKVLAMQVHYNTDNGVEADQSTFELMYLNGTTPLDFHEAYLIPLVADNFNIPAKSVGYEHHESYSNPVGLPIKVWGLLPHMHTRGKHINMKSDSECLVDVPDWDFHWQTQYFRPKPYEMGENDHVTMSCTWDNPDDRNITWGEGTSDEMCFAFVYATL